MRLFLIALGIVGGIAAVLFGVIFALVLPFSEYSEAASLAAVLAGLPLLALPSTAEFLEREAGRRSLAAGKPAAIRDFRAFQMAWPFVALYGFVVLIALDVVSTFILSVAALVRASPEAFDGDPVESAFMMAVLMNFPAMMAGAYLVGHWIGTRCSRRGVFAVLLTIVLLTAAAIGLNELTPAETYDRAFLLLNLLEFPFILLCALLGYWRGHKARWAKYLGYLLSVLPPETRDAMVDLVFVEAQKVAAARRSAIGSQSA
jgi:hypothetical protein